jgi:hypothetical protein
VARVAPENRPQEWLAAPFDPEAGRELATDVELSVHSKLAVFAALPVVRLVKPTGLFDWG